MSAPPPSPSSVPDLGTLFAHTGTLTPPGPGAYLDHAVEVPGTAGLLRVELDFDKVTDRFQLYAALLDPSGLLRGHVQCPGGPGPRALWFEVGTAAASPGCVAGPIPAGVWTVRLDLDRFRQPGGYSLRLLAGAGAGAARADAPDAPLNLVPSGTSTPAEDMSDDGEAWLRGELHAHSVHSDGRATVADLTSEARRQGLDFLAVTDHFTWSHWAHLPDTGPLITICSIEVTTHGGHANAHGLTQWVDVYVDRPGRTAGELAGEVHRQGGLVGVNHPYSGQQAWRRSDLDWAEVDVLEVVNQGQDANNDAAIGLWDRLLAQGYDVAPVAGTDCHDLDDPGQALGQVVTAVRVSERSHGGVLDGLRRAATVVTRGPHLELRLRSGGEVARLGQHLIPSGAVTVEVDVDTAEAATLYVFRDGLMWHQGDVEAGSGTLVVVDDDPVTGCYRAELHRRSDEERHWASAWRSHESFLALTSFVRVVAAT